MNKKLIKFWSLMLVLSMSIGAVSCAKNTSGKSENGNNILNLMNNSSETEETDETEDTYETDDTDVTDDTDPTDDPDITTAPVAPSGMATINPSLTYPDHVATYDEVHPAHAPGDVAGDEASDLLDAIEHDILAYSLESYVDMELLFDDPAAMGLYCESATWGDFSADNTYDIEFLGNIYDELLSIDYTTLDLQDKIFYDKILFDVEEDLYGLQYTAFNYYTSAFDPLTGPQCDLMFLLAVFEFETVEDAQNYIDILIDIDRYYDLILDFEEERAEFGFANSPSIYSQIAESFDNLVEQTDDCFLYESFEERLDNIDGLTDSERDELIASHESAMQDYFFPEMQECSDRMGALASYNGVDRGLCDFPGGEAYYAWRYRMQTNSGRTIAQGVEDIDTVITSLFGNYVAAIYTGNSEITEPLSMGDMTDNLNYLYTQISADFPDLPDHDYFTMDVPECFEDNFSPAAYLGYHLDRFDSNLIITNNSSVDEDFGITCAHEGYPGHMFQSVYTRSVCEHPYMFIADSIGYNEGWTEYVENFSYRYFTDNEVGIEAAVFENLFDVLLMARCDIGIHTENWSADDCAAYLNELYAGFGIPNAGYTGADLQDMYDLLVNVPNYATKYGVGYLHTSRLMSELHEQFPDASDREIHTAYLNALPGTYEQILPLAVAELEG